MGDEGCKVVCESLRGHSIERLNISANSASKDTVAALCGLIRLTNSIMELDVSCNSFDTEGCEQLRRSVEQNTSLGIMDIRQCGAEAEDELAIAENLRARQEKKDRAKIVSRPP